MFSTKPPRLPGQQSCLRRSPTFRSALRKCVHQWVGLPTTHPKEFDLVGNENLLPLSNRRVPEAPDESDFGGPTADQPQHQWSQIQRAQRCRGSEVVVEARIDPVEQSTQR